MDANFFWHGPAPNLFVRSCLTSFVRHGIGVTLHVFDRTIDVPEGVVLSDASTFASEDEVFAYTQHGKPGSIAAFTDIFRYRLFQKRPGWWFDTDVYCLSGPEGFEALERQSSGIVVGQQAPGELNGAVLFVSDPALARDLEQRANAKGLVFDWGAIGPDLVTEVAAERPGVVTVVPQRLFYPIHYRNADDLFLPERRSACLAAADGALCVHLWNEFVARWNIPQNILPCEGSYLAGLFEAVGARVEPDAALTPKTFASLYRDGELDRWGVMALDAVERAKRLKRGLVGK